MSLEIAVFETWSISTKLTKSSAYSYPRAKILDSASNILPPLPRVSNLRLLKNCKKSSELKKIE